MSRDNLVILVAAVLAAALGGWLQHESRLAHVPAGVTVAQAGEPAPRLELPDLQGRPHALADYRGRRVLLNFWASWCGPCLDELPALDRVQAKFGENGSIVLGIAMDDPAHVRAFLADHPVRYPVLLGRMAPPSTSLLWGDNDEMLPYSALIDANGCVIATHRGPLDAATLDQWLR
ncbi:TlpA family protein disulfide reductase [Rhodanobacter sp. 7MK24]|uniref:TlpA family protein disulfide reductase n=1 Tax=Rhodanobacter sp. 7MK24 TaxID=2775922 RepID=UPI0017877C90|nr:TlpA disulfide reductase family protein [Rhodanobacter sp. 7MK24]MBD8881177.1 TlpA family protein disulfide reductase [Rhodanobacter sp. 7MK24]